MVWDNLATIGPAGLVVMFIVSVLRGWLVPKRTFVDALALHADRLSDKDKVIAALTVERDAWHEAHTAEAKHNGELVSQASELMEAVRIMQHVAESLPKTTGGPRDRQQR